MSDDLVLLAEHSPRLNSKSTESCCSKKALQKALTKSLGDQFMISVANINILADSINTTLERTKDTVEELLRNTEDAVEKTSPPPPPQETDLSSAGNQYLECPVRVCDSLRVNLTVDEVKETIHFKNKLPGGRCTEFFGLVPYAYGRVKHSPRPIPDTPVFNKIFETMGSIGLNRENCTILCTLYENGNVDLPLHQDNEPSIEEGSTIYTISCGSTRNLKVYNTTGSLTDSIHRNTPENVFEQIPNHTCVKKECYQLSDVFKYENEFEFARTVILSSGVNDLSRYGKTANVLADLVCRKLEACCRKYSDTKFVFNSITHTKGKDWLNREIKIFNDYMYDLSRRLPNLSFFDSHRMIMDNNPDIVWDRSERGNGVHLCYNVRRMIVRGLVDAVGYLTKSHSPRFRTCRWLRNADNRSTYGVYG